MDTFNPSRLRLARRCRGKTQAELADATGLSWRSIAAFELGGFPPSNETLAEIAQALDFPVNFFIGDDLEWPDKSTVSFRAMSKRDMALAEGALALALSEWIEAKFKLPPSSLPDLSIHSTPEEAASALRHSWGWGEQPIPNMIHLLESKGVRVFSLSVQSREVDAFSAWKGETPFVFLNMQKSAERSRFDAAHELGHLVLHRHVMDNRVEAEREANEFASSFLMPRKGIIATAPHVPVLTALIKLKSVWNVSLAALIYRLNQVDKLNNWQYRTLSTELGRLGYRTNEPNPSPRETSQVLTKVFAALRKEGVSRAKVAEDLRIPQSTLNQIIFGLTPTALKGGRDETSPGNTSSIAQLRVMSSRDR
jgi:Zn-dependent peptidase ImmA (M78 family)/DNA-binding XRE family transcriptional regulator